MLGRQQKIEVLISSLMSFFPAPERTSSAASAQMRAWQLQQTLAQQLQDSQISYKSFVINALQRFRTWQTLFVAHLHSAGQLHQARQRQHDS